MKKILNKKFLIGFLFVFVLGVILILPGTLKAVVGVIEVTVTPDSTSLSYPNTGTTIHWTSSGADDCDAGGTRGQFDTGSLPVGDHTFTVECYKADPIITCDAYYVDLVTCFTSDTKVLMADGINKNIQDVKIGDVLKGESTDNKVLGLQLPKLNERKLYSFNGGRYFVTAEHPLKTIDGWKSIDPKKTDKENIGIKVTELKVGDTLITENGNVLLKTINSKNDKIDTQLYNFNLDGDHTYYADGYLVHNKANCNDVGYSCGSGQVCISGNGVCNGIIPGSCGPWDQSINCGNLRQDNTPYNCESLGCVWHTDYYSNNAGGYCDNQQYMGCTDMQSEDTCNVVSCGWTPSDSGSCSTISDSSNCTSTSGCSWSGGNICESCPGSCPYGYTASCTGSQTLCTENTPCRDRTVF